jgi:L-ascorbate metabolism protein UlaG (beta-lactamase superfamily)
MPVASIADVDAEMFPKPPNNSITFWGHACTYIDVNGVGIVTDPVFEKFLLVRWRKIGEPPVEAYADTEVIILSHAHPDHLSPGTIEKFPDSAVILCPPDVAGHLQDLPNTVKAMRPGDSHTFSNGEIVAVAARHSGGRYAWTTGGQGRALGYVIKTDSGTVFYSGDGNYFDGFDSVGLAFSPDITLLNINGHMHAEDAVRAARATQAPIVVPIHFGAYGYFFFPRVKKPRDVDVLERHLGDRLHVLEPGASIPLIRVP